MTFPFLFGPDSGSGGSSGTKGSPQQSLRNSDYDATVKEASAKLASQVSSDKISNDPLVGETVEKLRNEGVNIQNVNSKQSIGGITVNEIDIETTDVVIEVKSGGTKHHFDQFNRQMKYAQSINKSYIIFGPNIRPGVIKELRRCGFVVATSYDELIQLIKKGKKYE
jgi:hypothetical protein